MNLKHLSLIAIGTLLAGVAGAEDRRFYATAGFGPAYTDDINVVVPTGFGPPANLRLDLNSGFRMSAGVGYRVLDWFAVEGETGITANGFDGLAGTGVLSHVPLMANAVVRCNQLGKWEPFVGFGLGGALSVLNFDRAIMTPGGPVLDGADADAVFAWQAFGGVRYRFHDRMSAGLSYKYLNTGDADWKVKGLGRISGEGVSSHAISVNFAFEF